MSATWKSMWLPLIEETLWEPNLEKLRTFAIDDTSYVVEKAGIARTVYIPNAGAPSGVRVNETSYPIAASQRTDVVVEYNIDKYQAVPVDVPNEDETSTDYAKGESIVRDQSNEIGESMLYRAFVNWYPGASQIVRTSGDAVPAEAPGATGNRKAFTFKDVLAAKKKLDGQKGVKKNDRYLLIPSSFENELLEDLALNSNLNLSFETIENGLMKLTTKIAGFEVYSFDQVINTTSAGVIRPFDGSISGTTDHQGALAFSKSALSLAKPEKAEMLWRTPSAENYAMRYSMEAYFGNSLRREDKKGVVAIVQDASA